MILNKTIKDILIVIASNFIKLLSGVFVAFLLPKLFSVADYGYYRLFVLYLAYMGLFHFGFTDGIYLKYGGRKLETFNKIEFRSFTNYLIRLILMISILIALSTLFIKDNNTRIVVILLAVNLLSVQLTGYFQIISQITSRFKEFSSRTIILAIGNSCIVLVMYLFGIDNFIVYILCIIVLNYVMTGYYIFTYRDLCFGERDSFQSTKRNVLSLTQLGIPLLLANLTSAFVITIDKQIVSYLFSIEEFAIYSFSSSMIGVVTIVVSAMGVVLYPILKRTSLENLGKNYFRLNRLVISIVLLCLTVYFPIKLFIPYFLPQYIESLQVFRVALVGLVFISSVTAIKSNFFKITGKVKVFFLISLSTIVFMTTLNLISFYLFGSLFSMAISTLLSLFIWYMITEMYMVVSFRVEWKMNFAQIMSGGLIYFVATSFSNIFVGFVIYIVVTTFLLIFIYRNEIPNFLKR